MSHLPQIMKTIAKRILSKRNTQSNAEDENSNDEFISAPQQYRKTIVEQPSEEEKSQSQIGQVKNEAKKKDEQSQKEMEHAKGYFVKMQMRRLQILYPNFKQSQIQMTASKVWDDLTQQEKDLYCSKTLLNFDELQRISKKNEIQNYQQSSQQKIDHSNSETRAKHQATPLEPVVHQSNINSHQSQEVSSHSNQVSQQHSSQQSPGSRENENDETNTSSVIGERSQSQLMAPAVTYTLITLTQIQKSDSNQCSLSAQVNSVQEVVEKDQRNQPQIVQLASQLPKNNSQHQCSLLNGQQSSHHVCSQQKETQSQQKETQKCDK